MNEFPGKDIPLPRVIWWKAGSRLMILGLLVGFILSWSGLLLDWIFHVKEGSYVLITMPVFGLLGSCLFIAGLVTFIISAVQGARKVAGRPNGWRLAFAAAWFAVCSASGWYAASCLGKAPQAQLGGFFVVGILAGIGLRAGWIVAVGCGLTFVIGNTGSVFSLIGTQAMSGRETFIAILPPFACFFVVSFGIGAAVGLMGLLRFGKRVYFRTVLGFAFGGLLGAVLLCVLFVSGQRQQAVLLVPLVVAPTIGGAMTMFALGSARKPRFTDSMPDATCDGEHH